MVFSPEDSPNSVLILPLRKEGSNSKKKSIDWTFLKLITSERRKKEAGDGGRLADLSDKDRSDFTFDESVYLDAVVIPWYRNQDQPQHFYVAEICSHLNPKSDFPAERFESFELYYKAKYGIHIQVRLHSARPWCCSTHESILIPAELDTAPPRRGPHVRPAQLSHAALRQSEGSLAAVIKRGDQEEQKGKLGPETSIAGSRSEDAYMCIQGFYFSRFWSPSFVQSTRSALLCGVRQWDFPASSTG